MDPRVHNLHIERLVLTNNQVEETRIKNILMHMMQYGGVPICLEWFDLVPFFETGHSGKIKLVETDNFEIILDESKNCQGRVQFSILELKDYDDFREIAVGELMKATRPLAVIENKKLPNKYRFNYVYKD